MSQPNHRSRTVNGNEVELWGQDQRVDLAARRVAAQLPRNMSHVRVEAGVTTDDGPRVCVWVYPDSPGLDVREQLDGWTVEVVRTYDTGAAVHLLPEGR